MKRVAAEIAAEQPRTHRAYTARLFDLRETVIHDIRPTLLLLFAAAGLLFLITCANAAGLLLARSVARARETAMRVALGVSRGQLAAHYLAEGVLISLVGAAGGVLLALTITPADRVARRQLSAQSRGGLARLERCCCSRCRPAGTRERALEPRAAATGRPDRAD